MVIVQLYSYGSGQHVDEIHDSRDDLQVEGFIRSLRDDLSGREAAVVGDLLHLVRLRLPFFRLGATLKFGLTFFI